MDKEIIFYIIFGLIYLLSRIGKKKRKKQSQRPQSQQPQPGQQTSPNTWQPQATTTEQDPKEEEPAPMSFEDILKELSGEGKKSQSTPEPEPVPQPAARKPLVSEPSPEPVEPYESPAVDSDIDTEASDLWTSYKRQGDPVERAERNTEAADLWTSYRDKDKPKSAVRASSSKQDLPMERSDRFDVYDVDKKENPLAEEIREMLNDPEDVKKAVLISEILNRKY